MSSRTLLLLGFLLAIVLLISTKVEAARDLAENNGEYKLEGTKKTNEAYDPNDTEKFDNEGWIGPRLAACKLDETKETDEVYDAKFPPEAGNGRFTPRLAIRNCMSPP